MARKTLHLEQDFIDGFQSTEQVSGHTHKLYQYPARFSPLFVKAVIQNFTKKGDLILDPFMGSGTTLVECLISGRECLGIDINPIATFLAKTKIASFKQTELNSLLAWWYDVRDNLKSTEKIKKRHQDWINGGYSKNLPPKIEGLIASMLDSIDEFKSRKLRNLAKCVLLSTTKSLVESSSNENQTDLFIKKFDINLTEAINGTKQLAEQVQERKRKPVVALAGNAKDLSKRDFNNFKRKRASIVITSPPYPGVHILYHRWQVNGSKETSAPYWIIGSEDGNGENYYTLGGRSDGGVDKYFDEIFQIYSNIHSLLKKDALVFQMVAFSSITNQLPRFDEAMGRAGFERVDTQSAMKDPKSDYMTRRVPSRKWYADLQGHTDSSLEHLIIHQKK